MRFQVLGPVSVWAGDVRLDIRGSKMRTFLASLLLARGRVVSDARLIKMLWDEDLPTTTQAQVQTYASRLRSVLGAEIKIERTPPGYRLELPSTRPARLDLLEFEELSAQGHEALASGQHAEASRLLRSALARWSGQALGGVTDHLATVEQPRLEEAKLTAQEECIDAELALGRHQALITELTALVASHPLRERPRAQLMTALHHSGRTADALDVYQQFRTVLADELGLDPSTELQNLRQSIVTTFSPGWSGTVRMPAPDRGGAPVLPPEPSDFVGRTREVSRACAALADAPVDNGMSRVCAVSGMSGIGKTVLALRVARKLRHHYSDRQLLVELGGRSACPPDSRAVLLDVLDRLGVSPTTTTSTWALVEQLRQALAGTRTLLVLDDAADERQIRPLLSAVPGCGVLVTSRAPLAALEGVRRIALDALSDDESVLLLSRIAGAERVEAERSTAQRIAELCSGIPLAVRISGSRLATRPHWLLHRLAERLADPRRVLTELSVGDLDVRDCLLPTHAALDIELRRALDSLAALGPRDFSCATAAKLLGVSVTEAQDVLDDLVAAYVLRRDASQDGYRFPALILALVGERDEAAVVPSIPVHRTERAYRVPAGPEQLGDDNVRSLRSPA